VTSRGPCDDWTGCSESTASASRACTWPILTRCTWCKKGTKIANPQSPTSSFALTSQVSHTWVHCRPIHECASPHRPGSKLGHHASTHSHACTATPGTALAASVEPSAQQPADAGAQGLSGPQVSWACSWLQYLTPIHSAYPKSHATCFKFRNPFQ